MSRWNRTSFGNIQWREKERRKKQKGEGGDAPPPGIYLFLLAPSWVWAISWKNSFLCFDGFNRILIYDIDQFYSDSVKIAIDLDSNILFDNNKFYQLRQWNSFILVKGKNRKLLLYIVLHIFFFLYTSIIRNLKFKS